MTQNDRLRPFALAKLLNGLVDLVGIEPTTSSMPWTFRAVSKQLDPILQCVREPKTTHRNAYCSQTVPTFVPRLTCWHHRTSMRHDLQASTQRQSHPSLIIGFLTVTEMTKRF